MTPTNTPTSKCCESCENGATESGYSLAIAAPYCLNKNCPCHTPTTDSKNSSEDWEKEFEEVYAYSNTYPAAEYPDQEDESGRHRGYVRDLNEAKDFIRSQIQQAEARGRKNAVAHIRKNLLSVDQEEERALIFRATVEDLDNLLEAALETPS